MAMNDVPLKGVTLDWTMSSPPTWCLEVNTYNGETLPIYSNISSCPIYGEEHCTEQTLCINVLLPDDMMGSFRTVSDLSPWRAQCQAIDLAIRTALLEEKFDVQIGATDRQFSAKFKSATIQEFVRIFWQNALES